MKFHLIVGLALIAFFAAFTPISAQDTSPTPDSVIGQITSSLNESFVGGISGDGRLVVFESNGNLATDNPRNADGNREIFIFDYAQRRIFQITDTKSLLTDRTKAATFDNIRVDILNTRPVISNDGRWLAFGSNATTSVSTAAPNGTNPGNFDANTFTAGTPAVNPLTSDGNTEMWFYRIPDFAPATLTSGSEIPASNLSGGAFTQVTNSTPSRLPVGGTTTAGPIIADDNREASISRDGNHIAFVSNRNLAPRGAVENGSSGNNNDEVFSHVRSAGTTAQITQTPRGPIADPIFNSNPSISGDGSRIAFAGNGNVPITDTTGTNTDNNVEIFYTDINTADGTPVANTSRQITNTTRATPGQLVNVFDVGRRMSLDGRYIAFDSYADLANENGGANQTSFALYLYDVQSPTTFRRIGPRSNGDAGATGGDIQHYPGFTNYNSVGTGAPETLVFETRLNIRPDGTVATVADEGLNNNATRPAQIYSYQLSGTPAFRRLTNFPSPSFALASTQPIPSNSLRRMTFTLALTEVGTGNRDLANEAFYFLLPEPRTLATAGTVRFETGASRLAISASPVPTPTPGTTPTPTPSPTPQTPPAVFGVSPGMLAVVNYISGTPIVSQTAVGSLSRSFTLPIELSGVSVSINGAASGIKSVAPGEIFFVVPPGFQPPLAGTVSTIVINDNGTVIRGSVTLVPARPDVFTFLPAPGPNGRARILNVINRVQTVEPFTVTTVRLRGGTRVATVLRLFLTGVNTDVPASAIAVRVGGVDIPAASISAPTLREPGVYSIDLTLPAALNRAGDQPIIVTVSAGGQTFQSRLDDTAPRFRIL